MRKNKHEWKKIFENQPYDGMYEINKQGLIRNVKSKKVIASDNYKYSVTVNNRKYNIGSLNNLRWKYFQGEITGDMYLTGWKKVKKAYPNVPGWYFANIEGDILDVKNQKVRKWSDNDTGYQTMSIEHVPDVTRMLRHRVIGLLFIPNPENKTTIDHIDRNPLNNDISNLRWATVSEQMLNREMSEDFYKTIGRKGLIAQGYNVSEE